MLQLEFAVSSPKCVDQTAIVRPPPRLRIAALNIKTIPDASGKAQEVALAAVVHTTMRADAPTPLDAWRACRDLKRFTAVRCVDGATWPVGLVQQVKVRLPAHVHLPFV